MAKIPEWGAPSVQAPVRTGAPDNRGALAVGQAAENLGQMGMQVGAGMIRQANAMSEQEQQDAAALARAQASNALLDDEIRVRGVTTEIGARVADGSLPWNKINEEYGKVANELEPADIEGLDPAQAEVYRGGIKRNRETGRMAVDGMAKTAMRAEFKGQFYAGLDKLGKLANAPGADIERINAMADSTTDLAKQAQIDDSTIAGRLQQFKDNNWTNQARERLLQNRDNPAGLKQLEHDLTAADGYYVDKLDPEKRNAVWAQSLAAQSRLEEKERHETDKRDAKAERALDAYDRQVATTVAAPIEFITEVADAVKGTPFEAEFRERVAQEVEIRQVLAKPPLEQLAFIQTLEAKQATDGATVAEQANLKRMKGAVENGVKLLKESPLSYHANRTGQTTEPLDVVALASGDTSKATTQIAERMVTLQAMRKQYGASVGRSPLMPAETAALKSAVDAVPARQALQLFAGLNGVINDPEAYDAVMQQLAPDSPVRARAGQIYAKPGGEAIALQILRGETLLNPGKSNAAEDGKGGKVKMPTGTEIDVGIADVIGEAFAGRPDDYRTAVQSIRAVYATKSVDAGDMGGTFDAKRLEEAIAAVAGEPANVGGREVLPPWGVSSDTFEDTADTYIEARFKAAGIENPGGVSLLALRGRDGYYAITRGMQPLTDKRGQPLLIKMGAVK